MTLWSDRRRHTVVADDPDYRAPGRAV
jgi:hypothetical protein